VLLGLVVVGALFAWGRSGEPSKAGRASALGLMATTDTTPDPLAVRGRRFVIPRNYFRYPPELDPEAKGGFLLRVLLPNMEPFAPATTAAFNAPGHGRKMNILVEDGRTVLPLPDLLEVTLEGRPLDPPSAATHGLAYARMPDNDDDLYVGRQANEIEPYIRCRPVRPDMGSSCDHRFEWGLLDVKLGYGREHLPRWREIQDRVVMVLKSFEALSNQ
jgi:hypothetical protein